MPAIVFFLSRTRPYQLNLKSTSIERHTHDLFNTVVHYTVSTQYLLTNILFTIVALSSLQGWINVEYLEYSLNNVYVEEVNPNFL